MDGGLLQSLLGGTLEQVTQERAKTWHQLSIVTNG